MFLDNTNHDAEESMASGIGARWVRLNITYYHDPKVRRARAAYLWPYLLVLMGEHRGYIPEDYLDAYLIAQDLGLDEETISKTVERVKSSGLLYWDSTEVNVGGRGGPNLRTLEGWTTKNWASYQPDPRGSGRNRPRDGKDMLEPSQLHNNTIHNNTPPSVSPPKSMQELESMVLACIPAGRRRGGMCLDSISMQKLMKLVEEHGMARCAEELSECGGSERPVAMLAKRLGPKTGSRSKASPPTASEWKSRG